MKDARGFTLIELMAAILVLGIVLGFAIPNFREMTRNNRIAASQNELLTALALARNEALHRSQPVSICASTDGASCSGGTDWKPGWIVFSDVGGTAGSFDTSDGDQVIQIWGGLEGETKVTGPTSLSYSPTGMQAPAGTKTFTVYYDKCSGAKARLVSIGAIGSVTATQTSCPTS